jgi:hypothetical protein
MLRSAGLESFRLFRRWPAQLDEATAAGPHRPALGEAEDLGEAQAERGAQRDG